METSFFVQCLSNLRCKRKNNNSGNDAVSKFQVSSFLDNDKQPTKVSLQNKRVIY